MVFTVSELNGTANFQPIHTDFQTKNECKCKNGAEFVPAANWITGCDCTDTGHHGWYCEIPDASLCMGNTDYVCTLNRPGDVKCKCKDGFFGDIETGCIHHCDISDELSCPESSLGCLLGYLAYLPNSISQILTLTGQIFATKEGQASQFDQPVFSF